MTSFTFSAEQIKSRRQRRGAGWRMKSPRRSGCMTPNTIRQGCAAGSIAACTIEEAAQIFSLISGNFLVTPVFRISARNAPRAGHTVAPRPQPRRHATTCATRRRASARRMSQCDHPSLAESPKQLDSLALTRRARPFSEFMKPPIAICECCASSCFPTIPPRRGPNQSSQTPGRPNP